MSSKIRIPNDEAAILRRVIQPRNGNLTKTAARVILGLAFSDEDLGRMNELAAKYRESYLSAEEQSEMDSYRRVGAWLSLMKSKARLTLKQTPKSTRKTHGTRA